MGHLRLREFVFKTSTFLLWSFVTFIVTVIFNKVVFGNDYLFFILFPVVSAIFILIAYITSLSRLASKFLLGVIALVILISHASAVVMVILNYLALPPFRMVDLYFWDVLLACGVGGLFPILWRAVFLKKETYKLERQYWLVGLIVPVLTIVLLSLTVWLDMCEGCTGQHQRYGEKITKVTQEHPRNNQEVVDTLLGIKYNVPTEYVVTHEKKFAPANRFSETNILYTFSKMYKNAEFSNYDGEETPLLRGAIIGLYLDTVDKYRRVNKDSGEPYFIVKLINPGSVEAHQLSLHGDPNSPNYDYSYYFLVDDTVIFASLRLGEKNAKKENKVYIQEYLKVLDSITAL